MRILLDSRRLGEALKEGFKQVGVTQEQVAVDLKIKQGAVSNYCKGKFKTVNEGVIEICKDAKIDPLSFAEAESVSEIPAKLEALLQQVCSRGPNFERAAHRVLHALKDVS